MKGAVVLVLAAACCAAAGCQCSPLLDPYGGLIDHLSDAEPTLDKFYHPGLDLNRIGRPDWCAWPLNQWLCRRACCFPRSPCPPGYLPVYERYDYGGQRDAVEHPYDGEWGGDGGVESDEWGGEWKAMSGK